MIGWGRRFAPASAQTSLADDARDLLTDQALDKAREMVVEPGLQQWPQGVANDFLERAVGSADRQISLGPPLPRHRAEPGEGGGGGTRCRRRENAFAQMIRFRHARGIRVPWVRLHSRRRSAAVKASLPIRPLRSRWTGAKRRTEPSASIASVSSRISRFSPRSGRIASDERLSSAMMRPIEAIISSIEGSAVGLPGVKGFGWGFATDMRGNR